MSVAVPLVSEYSVRLQEIATLLSRKLKPAIIHHEKLSTALQFLERVQSTVATQGAVALTETSSAILKAFDETILLITKLGTRSAQRTAMSLLMEHPTETTFKTFLRFWEISLSVIRLFDKSSCPDFGLLVAANIADLTFLNESVDLSQIPNVAAEVAGCLSAAAAAPIDIAKLSLTTVLCESPFSYFLDAGDSVLEVFKSTADDARFQTYVSFLQKLPRNPLFLGFQGATTSAPFCVAHEKFECLVDETDLDFRDFWRQASSAIDLLHSHGISHRFISPECLFVTSDRRIKLGGFYFAGGSDAVPLSLYAAPAQVANHCDNNAESDIFSFGLVAWHILTKSSPPGGGRSPPVPPGYPALGRCWSSELSIDAVIQKQTSQDLVGRDIIALCEAAETNNPATRERAVKGIRGELQRNTPFQNESLFRLIKLSKNLPEIQRELYTFVQKMPYRAEFSVELLAEIDPEYGVEFMLNCGVHTDALAKILLNFAARQTPELTTRIIDAVLQSHPNVLFDVINESRIYYTRGLDLISTWSGDELLKNSRFLSGFLDAAQDADFARISQIVDKIPVNEFAEFDRDCVVLKKLAEWGFYRSVLRFAQSAAYGKRLLTAFFPKFKPSFLLRLTLRVSKVPQLQTIVSHIPVARLIVAVMLAGEYELAARASANLFLNTDLSAQVARKLELMLQNAPVDKKSAVCLCLVPYALYTNYVPNSYVIDSVAILLQSDDVTDISRALVLGVAIAQNKDVARKLADPYNLDAICRFLRSKEIPDSFLWTAGRFFLAIAPYLRLDRDTFGMVNDAVENVMAMGMNSGRNTRLVLVVSQILAATPPLEKWTRLLESKGLAQFVNFAMTNMSADPKVTEMVALLHDRFHN